jgi:ABC-type nitrate/sulfonate/bicarbonate transport system substrate-binding protein
MSRALFPVFAVALITGMAPAAGQTPESTTIVLPSSSIAHATTFIAADLDLFRDQGLNATTSVAAGALDAVAAGRSDWTLTPALAFARLAAGGRKTLALANLLERPPMEIVLRKNLAVQGKFDPGSPVATRGKLLRGRTIAVDAAYSSPHGWLTLIARKAGLAPETDVKLVILPEDAMAAAMSRGEIDGFVASAPASVSAARDGSGVILASGPAGDAPEFQPSAWSLLATRPDICQTRKSVCEKIVKAYVEASRIMRDEPLRTTLVLKRRFPALSDDALKASIETVRRSTPIFPAVTSQALANSESFAAAAGLLKPEETLKSFDGLFTNEFVR